MTSSENLVVRMFAGDRLALARLISHVENRSEDLLKVMAKIQEKCGRAHVTGVTGPPGSGKSTLVDRMITEFRRQGKKVGVVAIDPTSPFSGGAVLGDRIRMQDHAGDESVFIRSLGSRGSRGGLSRATREVVKLYDAFGMDEIMVETVGVGQTELDIMELADTTLVLLTPESGDAIQTLKAGILEIADIFVVNKADRDGADRMIMELKVMLELGVAERWKVPVIPLQALHGKGVTELMTAVQDHTAYLRSAGSKDQTAILTEEVKEIVFDELKKKIKINISNHDNPYKKAEEILENLWEKSAASTRRPRSSSPKSRSRMKPKSKRR